MELVIWDLGFLNWKPKTKTKGIRLRFRQNENGAGKWDDFYSPFPPWGPYFFLIRYQSHAWQVSFQASLPIPFQTIQIWYAPKFQTFGDKRKRNNQTNKSPPHYEAVICRWYHTYQDLWLNLKLFLSGYGFRPPASCEFGSESGYLWMRSPEWKKNWQLIR